MWRWIIPFHTGVSHLGSRMRVIEIFSEKNSIRRSTKINKKIPCILMNLTAKDYHLLLFKSVLFNIVENSKIFRYSNFLHSHHEYVLVLCEKWFSKFSSNLYVLRFDWIKKIICFKDFLWCKEMFCFNETKFFWFKQNIFGPNKYLFESNKFLP